MDQNKNKTQHPHVLKNGASKWPPFAWDLDHWCTLLKESVGDRNLIKSKFYMEEYCGRFFFNLSIFSNQKINICKGKLRIN